MTGMGMISFLIVLAQLGERQVAQNSLLILNLGYLLVQPSLLVVPGYQMPL
tara:strand:- start:605 stop:757 length:153 start_codon:yes stop_codon:yes gene_type:complete